MPFGKYFLAFLVVIAGMCMGQIEAQTSANPFDIVWHSSDEQVLTVVPLTGNPFDIVPRAGSTQPLAVNEPSSPKQTVAQRLTTPASRDAYRQLIFFLLLDGFILFTILYLLFGQWLRKVWQSIRNPQLLAALYREWGGRVHFPLLMWYGFFVYSLSTTLLLGALHLGLMPVASRVPWRQWVLFLAATAGWLVVRHLLLRVVGAIFRSESLRLYSFAITTYNVVLGVVFIPIALAWAYGLPSWHGALVWISGGLLLLAYIYRAMSLLAHVGVAMLKRPFLFLLYICAVEIAPIVVAVKFLSKL